MKRMGKRKTILKIQAHRWVSSRCCLRKFFIFEVFAYKLEISILYFNQSMNVQQCQFFIIKAVADSIDWKLSSKLSVLQYHCDYYNAQ